MTDTEKPKLSAAEWKRCRAEAFRAVYQKYQAAKKQSEKNLPSQSVKGN